MDPEGYPVSSEPKPPFEDDGQPRDGRRWWIWLLVVAVLAGGAWLLLGDGTKAGAKPTVMPRAVPVVTAPARVEDVARAVNGLGTVTPLQTVTVRSRVDGQLVSVAFHEGQIVGPGDLLAQIDPRPFQVQLMQAEGQLAKDQAALTNAQADLRRYEALIQQDSISRQQLDTQKATVSQSEAAIQSDQAQIEGAKLNLAYSRITAPIGGRVGLRLVDPGNMVHAADANGLVVITQLHPIAVVFTLPGDQLGQVLSARRSGAKLAVEAYDRELRKRLASGELVAIDNQIDTATGTVRLKAEFPNQDDALFPNQFVNARLLVETLRGALVVPTAALQRSPQSAFVWRVKPDDTVEAREVEVELTQGDETVLRKGLAAGDEVVVDGVDKLQPGSRVTHGAPGAPAGGKTSG